MEQEPLDPQPGVLPADFTEDFQVGEAVGVKSPSAAGTAAAAAAAAAEQRKGSSAWVQCQGPYWSSGCGGERRNRGSLLSKLVHP